MTAVCIAALFGIAMCLCDADRGQPIAVLVFVICLAALISGVPFPFPHEHGFHPNPPHYGFNHKETVSHD